MEQKTREEIVGRLKKAPASYREFLSLNDEWKERFLNFCQGKKTLPLMYEPIFQMIFDFEIHPERLSSLISALLNQKVEVLEVLPREDSLIAGKTLLILDVVARTDDGSLVNVEVQKQGYYFPGERVSCYSADLVMRQYTLVKSQKGNDFTYRDMKKVYVIVIYEESTKEFHAITDHYIHYGKTVFDTGLGLELLQEYCLIALDVFRNFQYPKSKNEQTAWLSLLATENLDAAEVVLDEYPWFEEIYREMAELREKPEEVLGMFSDALRILDENTLNYMIEDMKKQADELQKQNEELKRANQFAESELQDVIMRTCRAEEQQRRAEEQKRQAEQALRLIEEENQMLKQQLETMRKATGEN